MTDVSYKMVMKLVKEEIEKHLKESGLARPEQAGFTRGGEILDNLLILQECVRKTYRERGQLVVWQWTLERHMTR